MEAMIEQQSQLLKAKDSQLQQIMQQQIAAAQQPSPSTLPREPPPMSQPDVGVIGAVELEKMATMLEERQAEVDALRCCANLRTVNWFRS